MIHRRWILSFDTNTRTTKQKTQRDEIFLTWIGLTLIWWFFHPLVGAFDGCWSWMKLWRWRSIRCTWTAHVTARHGDGWRWQTLKSVVDVFIVVAVVIAVLRRLIDGQKSSGSDVIAGSLQQRSSLWWCSVILVTSPIGTRLMKHMVWIVNGLWGSISVAKELSRVWRLVVIVGRVPGCCWLRRWIWQVGTTSMVLLVHRERVVVVRHHNSNHKIILKS